MKRKKSFRTGRLVQDQVSENWVKFQSHISTKVRAFNPHAVANAFHCSTRLPDVFAKLAFIEWIDERINLARYVGPKQMNVELWKRVKAMEKRAKTLGVVSFRTVVPSEPHGWWNEQEEAPRQLTLSPLDEPEHELSLWNQEQSVNISVTSLPVEYDPEKHTLKIKILKTTISITFNQDK